MSHVQSVERAFAILEAVASRDLGLTDIADEVELPKSTVARLLQTLDALGAVERHRDDGTYQVGPTVRRLAGGGPTVANLTVQAHPYLAMLARELGEDAALSAADTRGVRYIAQVNADNTIQVSDWTGVMVPMHVVPSGLVILAHWPAGRVERVLRGPLERYTAESIIDPDALRDRLEQIRQDGYCWVYGEFSEELNSVAAPVFGPSGVLGAVNVHGPAFRFPASGTVELITQRVVEVAALLTETYRAAS